jgi:DNA mismatch endonuclease (patch repair protein)
MRPAETLASMVPTPSRPSTPHGREGTIDPVDSQDVETRVRVGYPLPSSEAVTRVMRGNRRSDTRLEIRVRSELHRRGLRFRKQLLIIAGDVRVRADVAFPRQRLAVFLDGCFWHRCPEHGNSPRANSDYWSTKLDRNVERDQRVLVALDAAGWSVLRIWEHVPASFAADQVQTVLAECKAAADAC